MNIFDKYYKEYDLWYERNNDVFMTEINAIRRFELKGKGIEIGVGTGRFAGVLNIAYGIDTSLNMLKLAEQRGVNTLHAKGESNPYEDNYFDYAVIISTLCFTEDPLALLKEAYRILKKPGLLVAAILKRDSDWVRYYQSKGSRFYGSAHFYNPEEVIDLFGKTGFSYQESFQSLFKSPENFNQSEEPVPGYDRGSFVALGAAKIGGK